jgi:catechol 2,3-dioxygenase-like lactoylglutathione lyase family enzyme
MKPQVSAISLGVQDLDRANRFYTGLGWSILDEHPEWVSFRLGEGSSMLGLRPWQALAEDAGAAPDGSGPLGRLHRCPVGGSPTGHNR